ncbi:MAG: hypothetical protein MIO90_00375, partial [Methanomassiliicoccales archaeon]|nr:hypothetical protein [Methanomassiliicoccales archaeon]
MFANFEYTNTAIYLDNTTGVTCSDLHIWNTNWGVYADFYGPSQSISLTLSDIVMDDVAFTGISVLNNNGSLDLMLNGVAINDSGRVCYIYIQNDEGSAKFDLTITGSSFTNASQGIYAFTDVIGDVQITDSEFITIYDYCLWIEADAGDMALTLDGVTIDDCYGGVYLYVEFGNVDMTITDSMLSGEDVLVDITVNSNMLTNGFVNIAVTNSEFSEAAFGIRTWSEELVLEAMMDNEFVDITGAALHFDVRSATSTDDVLSLAFTNVTMVNVGTGLFVYVNDGSLDLSLVGVNFDTIYYGVQVEVSSVLDTNMSSINMEVIDSVIEGGMYGIFATSVNGGSVLISGSEFLGQSEISYNFDSVYGDVDVEIVDTVFDGSSSETAGTVYTVEQIDYEFELYGRTHAWDGIYYGGGNWIELPFTFQYNGNDRTDVYFSEEGYLDFGPGSSIRPIGTANLAYDGDHFFGYIVAEDESYVLFNWYARNVNSGYEESNAFQVILYANGEIQFNFAAMDGLGGSNAWGLLNSNFPNIDYNMYQLMDYTVWYADYSSFLFTPHDLSRGMGIQVRSEVGDIDFVLDNSTITSYYRGGVFTQASDGNMVFTATENTISYMYALNDLMGPTAVIVAGAYNGTINASIVNNTFLRLWAPAVGAFAVDSVGGAHSFEVTGNEFIKTYYGVYTDVQIYSGMRDEPVNDTLSVVANFQNNIMTDSFGLANGVYLQNVGEVNWNISVEQTFTGNVMTQVWYEGTYPLQNHWGYPGMIILSELDIEDYQSDVATSMTVEHMVTITDNEIEQAVDGSDGIWVGSDLYKSMGDVDNVCSLTITNNVMTAWSGDGIDVEVDIEAASGTVNSDTSVVIEDNQITDLDWDITAIEVSIEGWSDSDAEMALDMSAITYVSITGNVVEGAYEGIYVYIEYDQDNTVGDWMVNVTVHIDGNQLSNVTYGVSAEIYGGVWFGENYWPLNDEVAVGTFVMDYLLTIDDNVVYSIWGDEDGPWDAIFYVDAGYWAEVDPSTLFTEAYATVTGEISVSGNEVTQENGDLTLLYLYHEYGAEKTGVIDVNVDIAIENNVFEVVYNDYMGWYTDFGMYLEDYVYLYGNMAISTDKPTVMADVSWSVTGNAITGLMEVGIAMLQETYIYSPDCMLTQDLSADISGNTIDGATDGGIGFVLERSEFTNGYVELNVDLSIADNTVMMSEDHYTFERRQVSGVTVAFGESGPMDAEVSGRNVNIDVLVSGNTIIGAEVGISLGRSFYEDDDFLAPDMGLDVYEVNFVVENNYISDSYYGIYAYGGDMTLSNNVIEDCVYGIGWDYANGEIIGNTITAIYGIEI